jgi:acetyltransferase-like isoleucine patch superfamily enzyme
MRKLDRFPVQGVNSMRQFMTGKIILKACYNFIIITIGRFFPFIEVKNQLYRGFLGMHIDNDVSLALMLMPDLFFPNKIHIGSNTIIGYNTTILCHEFMVDEYRIGEVHIGKDVMIGANCTILPGVVIGDGSIVAAGAVVACDVPANQVYGGVPAKFIRMVKDV